MSCLTELEISSYVFAHGVCILAFKNSARCVSLSDHVTHKSKTYRATPTIKLLERRSARGTEGSVMRPQSWVMSAPITSRFGSFLNEDLAPRVAASLQIALSTNNKVKEMRDYYHRRPKPLSRRDRRSEVKNMREVDHAHRTRSYKCGIKLSTQFDFRPKCATL